MDKKTSDQWIAQFSKAAIETIKQMAAQGHELSADSLFQTISKHKDIKEFIFQLSNLTDHREDATKHRDGPSQNELQTKMENALKQKETLLKQMDELEENVSQVEGFYKRLTLQLIQMLAPLEQEEDQPLQASIDKIHNLLKRDAKLAFLEKAFKEFKEATLREHKRPTSFFSRLLKSDPGNKKALDTTVAAIKEAYQELVDELGLHLDEQTLKKLQRIGKSIQKADNLETFYTIRKEISALIQDYLAKLNHDRLEAATIFKEIASHLIDVEKHLLGQIAFADKTFKSNEEFNTLLEKNIEGLNDSVKFSKTMEELKGALLSKITIISRAILDKRKSDQSNRDSADQEVQQLKRHLKKMQGEIQKEQERSKSLEKEILTDPLTGAYNRRAYDQRMLEELQRFIRYKSVFSVLILDVDHFKHINDTYGHAIGDKCLQEIINRAKPSLRVSDFLARFGGEEFVALLPETPIENAQTAAEKLRKVIENIDFIHEKQKVKITISIGLTQVKPTDRETDTIFDRMDKALYQAKESGRNKVVVLI